MGLIVQKFGGSSVADFDKIKNVANRVIKTKNQGNKVVVVVSAMGKTTDKLIHMAKSANTSPNKRELDMLLSTGEQISISLLAMTIQSLGETAISLTGIQAGIQTDEYYNKAKITNIDTKRIKEELEKNSIVVVAGFQGLSPNGDITTLGRGGSDTTAVALASALKADLCEIYTDVDGVYSVDPRIVPDSKKLSEISYDEMLELSALGAKVLHARSVELAKVYSVKLHVRSSFNENPGTIVLKESLLEKEKIVTGIAQDKNAVKIAVFGIPDVPGAAQELLKNLSEHMINLKMIVQSTAKNNLNNISFVIDSEDKDEAVECIKDAIKIVGASGYEVKEDLAMVSIVGAGMITNPGCAYEMFKVFGDNDINIELVATSEITVSTVIEKDKCDLGVKLLSKHFFLTK